MGRVARKLVAAVAAITFAVAACTSEGSDSGAKTNDSTMAPDAVPEDTVHVATLNVLHGIDPALCPPDTDFCAAPARLALLMAEIEAADCPEIVGLQEIGPRQTELVPELLPGVCGGDYELVFNPEGEAHNSIDQEMVLTTLPVIDESYVDLANFPWGAQWARVESGVGLIDVVTTHLASSENNPPCNADNCPQPCARPVSKPARAESREVLGFLDGLPTAAELTLVTGDLNQPIDHERITTFLDAGFEDTWTRSGNPECDPSTGEGCTCCVGTGEVLDGLDDPTQHYDERIDFVLVRGSESCTPEFGAATTGPFAGEPAPEPVDGVVWASDHGGVQAELWCA